MLKFTRKFIKLRGKREEKADSFFDLSSREQKKILDEAVRGANKDQLELVKKYKDSAKFRECIDSN